MHDATARCCRQVRSGWCNREPMGAASEGVVMRVTRAESPRQEAVPSQIMVLQVYIQTPPPPPADTQVTAALPGIEQV